MISRYDTDVEEVLNSAIALEYFKEWIRLDPTRQEEATDLYFALKGFKNYLQSHDVALRAQMIHRKYISLKSGSCSFLPSLVRQEMSNRIHALKPSSPISETLFEPVWQPLVNMFKSWHARFVCSEPFNRLLENDSQQSKGEYQEIQPVAPPETMRRPKKIKRDLGGPSTSQKQDVPPNHEKGEERERFAKELVKELQKILGVMSRFGDDVYPRDLPRREFSTKEKIHEKTTSDEELEKYAEKIDRRRSDSESPPTTSFLTNPFPPLVSRVPGYDFNIVIPDRLTYNPKKTRTPGFNESSGFCSNESAYFSERSFPGHTYSEHSFTPFTQTLQRTRRSTQQNCFATLPRRPSQSKIQCRFWKEGDVAPYTADLLGPSVTLYQFRKTFGIRRDENTRLLFKSPCDDDSAAFQWNLISDDETILPMFGGKIVAEGRRYVDSD